MKKKVALILMSICVLVIVGTLGILIGKNLSTKDTVSLNEDTSQRELQELRKKALEELCEENETSYRKALKKSDASTKGAKTKVDKLILQNNAVIRYLSKIYKGDAASVQITMLSGNEEKINDKRSVEDFKTIEPEEDLFVTTMVVGTDSPYFEKAMSVDNGGKFEMRDDENNLSVIQVVKESDDFNPSTFTIEELINKKVFQYQTGSEN